MLVLSLTTGLASPQFNVTIDDSFHFAQCIRYGTSQEVALWQGKSKFVQGNTEQAGQQQGMRIQTGPSEGDPQRTNSEFGLSRHELSHHLQRILAAPPPAGQDIQPRPTEIPESAEYLRQLPQAPTPQDMPTQPEPDTSILTRSQRAAIPPLQLIEALEAQVYEETTAHVAY